MQNPIKRIHQFNKEAGLLEKGYDDFLESSYQVEEALEGFSMFLLDDALHGEYSTKELSPKEMSRSIISLCYESTGPLSDVDRLDKACDAVVFGVGSMAKLGLNPQQITQALNIVMDSNFQKLGAPKDEHGKQLKPEGWTGPEPRLQELLGRR